MTKQFYKFGAVFAFLPIFAIPATEINSIPSAVNNNNVPAVTIEDTRSQHAAQIDKYFKDRSMPLYGEGMDFVLAAEKYGLDYRLLPAIAVRESSGGKNACYNNPFGWGSCKIKFSNYDEAIEALGKNLGGANKKTASYYAQKSTLEKLYYYNGTVVPSYPGEVVKIMDKIGNVEIDTELAVK
jgi:hypothetical protein